MMKIVCDLCGCDVREADVRYVGVWKLKDADGNIGKVPVMPDLEICVMCCDKVRYRINET